MPVPLACSVRDCGLPLEQQQSSWSCARGHSFDVARSGYISLLQPQDRRSAEAGDPLAAFSARQRLIAAGIGECLRQDLLALVRSLNLSSRSTMVDLGCGTGEWLASIAAATGASGVGIDLATAAIDRAAKAHPALTWVVANADRRLPLPGGCIDLIMSINARRNPVECARVVSSRGWLLVVVPAPDDLIELRREVLGQGVERQRRDVVMAEHRDAFILEQHVESRERPTLSADHLQDLLTGTYRGARRATHERRAALEPMQVTLASDLLLFRRIGG